MASGAKLRPQIRLTLEPGGKTMDFPRAKTALQLLHALGLKEETALVARNGRLLTPDQRIMPGDEILVRIVGSRG